ncbi:hypothetical protein PUN28_010461 [Cardiocondyla obscurior]|uniref:Uncharacterized protein n=1 Tax=Cardiocondyla obscurior TaxID=286306 RepID=A0AAW2FLY0_9HYME
MPLFTSALKQRRCTDLTGLPHSRRNQTDNLSASQNLEIEALSNSFDDKSDDMLYSSTDIKIRTWLHSFLDNPTAEDSIAEENEIPIKDEARPTNPISDESDEVQQDSISASRRPKQDRKRSTDCPKRIGEDGVRSQNTYNEPTREDCEVDPATAPSQDNLSSIAAVHDQIAASTSLNAPVASTSTEQSTSNWSHAKNKKLPKIIKDILLTPNSKYNSAAIRMLDNKRKCNISTHLEFTDKKQDAIDKNLNLSDINSPPLSDILLSCRLINKTDINSTSNLPIHITSEKFKKLKLVKSVKSRERSNVQRIPDEATFSLNTSRLFLRKKSELDNNSNCEV